MEIFKGKKYIIFEEVSRKVWQDDHNLDILPIIFEEDSPKIRGFDHNLKMEIFEKKILLSLKKILQRVREMIIIFRFY